MGAQRDGPSLAAAALDGWHPAPMMAAWLGCWLLGRGATPAGGDLGWDPAAINLPHEPSAGIDVPRDQSTVVNFPPLFPLMSAAIAAARAGLPRLPTRHTPEPESEPAPSGAQERAAAVFRSLGLGPNGELILGGLSTARPRSAATEEAVGPPAVVYSSSIEHAAPATARTYYKAVAVVRGGGGGGGGGEGGRFLSIYDGATEYRIGVDVYQPMDRNNMRETCGGFFCYTDAQQVFSAIVPSNSVLKSADRVVLKCLGWGATRRFPNGKMCVERCVIRWCPPFSHL
eukprot:COSAG01_NODE_5384_length_4294_cov_1.988796_4_plen_286_part_00